MKLSHMLVAAIVLSAALIVMGCSSSHKTTTGTETQSPAPETKAGQMDQKVDTVNVGVQNNQKPTYESGAPSTTGVRPAGRYSVQIGAYQMPDNADRVASLAKERFTTSIYTFLDKKDNLYKVMIGDFTTKDDARRFRDDMVQKYPGDYKDAWVSENTQY